MKLPNIQFLLLTAGVCGLAAREPLHAVGIDSANDSDLSTFENRDGWVNPEDLPPMPQCIAQQDQSTWLNTMTRCTSSRCTRHFGIICTHHQWLTQLSCLDVEFSPDVLKGYLPYCSRSVLAKAQLYQWVRKVTSRTWLVDVGDANELQSLSPASLGQGYAAMDVMQSAPTCLTSSNAIPSMEAFSHVMASCGFTSTTQHTGNAARAWEYNEPLRSMTALDFETVAYDLTGRSIRCGNYFDKQCFCGAFMIDANKESCSGPGMIDLTRERLWMNATCGPASLPGNWMDGLKTTELEYISVEDWHGPKYATDMLKQVIELTHQCTTDACEIDSSGFCRVVRAIDRACFCRDISYTFCEGSCLIFEARIDYVNWLHDICGDMKDWHGLPDDWRHLAVPTTLEMIPWQWTLKASNKSAEKCASTEWKFGSLALINIAPILATSLIWRKGVILRRPQPEYWIYAGILTVTLQYVATFFNALLVQKTGGYEDIPVIKLTLLWCSMPRLTWLTALPVGIRTFRGVNISTTATFLFVEAVLQVLSSVYMVTTFKYGIEHNFYLGGVGRLDGAPAAKLMYAGALMWLLVFVVLLCTAWRMMTRLIGTESTNIPKWQGSEASNHAAYGTFPTQHHTNTVPEKAFVSLNTVTIMSMLLWIAQWLFWGGFIGLSQEEFCPPKLGLLTAIWVAFSSAAPVLGLFNGST